MTPTPSGTQVHFGHKGFSNIISIRHCVLGFNVSEEGNYTQQRYSVTSTSQISQINRFDGETDSSPKSMSSRSTPVGRAPFPLGAGSGRDERRNGGEEERGDGGRAIERGDPVVLWSGGASRADRSMRW